MRIIKYILAVSLLLFISNLAVAQRQDALYLQDLEYLGARVQSAESVHELAEMYRTGAGRPLDYVMAHFYYLISARQGYVPSMTKMANMYFRGQGWDADPSMAYTWYSVAAIFLEDEVQRDYVSGRAKEIAQSFTDEELVESEEAVAWWTEAIYLNLPE